MEFGAFMGAAMNTAMILDAPQIYMNLEYIPHIISSTRH